MSDLSRDARDLIAQAKKDGPALLGPSTRDRARVREKLTPLWAANAPLPKAKRGWGFRLGSVVVIAGLAALGWIARPEGTKPAAPQLTAAGHETQKSSTTLPLTAADPSDGVTTLQPAAGADHASVHESAARDRVAQHVSRQLPGKRVYAAAHAGLGATAEAERSERERAAPDERISTHKSTEEHSSSEAPRTDGAMQASTRSGVSVPLATPLIAEAHSDAPLERTPLTASAKAAHNSAAHSDMHPSPPSIDGELELLSAAQSALQQQRPSRALNLLQEHAFRFPTGALSEERMALQALALCASGRKHAAQTVLSNLEARAVPSQLLPRVRSQCGL